MEKAGPDMPGPQPDGSARESREPDAASRRQSSDNWDWIVAHPEVLEPYRGEYVAIWDKQVVLHGKDPYALHDALKAGPLWEKPLLVFRVPTRDEVDGILVL